MAQTVLTVESDGSARSLELECPPRRSCDYNSSKSAFLVTLAGLWDPRSFPGSSASSLPDPQEQLARLPQQFAEAPTFRKGLARIIAMLERVLVTSRGA
jgi:hypothetical protein